MRYVALLGGINVGGHRVKMDRLRDEFVALGFDDVSTFIASGNVVFSASGRSSTLERRIEDHLGARLGYTVPTMLRRADTLDAIAAREPFGPVPVGHTLQVVFLEAAPAASASRAVESMSNAVDRFAVHDRELYWQIAGKIMDSTVTASAIAKATGRRGTARNVTSLRRLVATL